MNKLKISDVERDEKPFLVLNASAGSGKTHNLVLEYLTILLSEKGGAKKYRSIVAMTFTNKAASEMKSRIVETLDGLANPSTASSKIQLMRSDLLSSLSIENEELTLRSNYALAAILHGYEDFQVLTMDKFNLKLIRSFSRDLDLPGEFEVNLDERKLMEDVVDVLLSKLGNPNEERLTEMVKHYAEANIEEGESWDFKRKLIDFVSILNAEKNSELVEKLMQQTFDKEGYNEIRTEMRELENQFQDLRDKALTTFNFLQIDSATVSGGKTTLKTLSTFFNATGFPVPRDNGEIFSDSVIKNFDTAEKKHFPNELTNELQTIQQFHRAHTVRFELLKRLKANYFNMALLQYVANSVNDIQENEQLIRISEFNRLISQLVRGEDAPYIYERLGTRLEHYLLDEFQDTSRLQWLNIVPLLYESLSYKRRNLIVGDAKQSIYRFNNGLAEQFVELPRLYNPENDSDTAFRSEFFNEMGVKVELDTNFRSSQAIVSFNNSFFQLVQSYLKAELPKEATFYDAVYQHPNHSFDGYVNIVSAQEKVDDEYIFEEILRIIHECDKANFKRGEICILTARNKEGSKIANFLNSKDITVVSQESLMVCDNTEVELLLAYFKCRKSPKESAYSKRFAELYIRYSDDLTILDYLNYFENVTTGKKSKFFDFKRFINDNFEGESSFYQPYENLYDCATLFLKLAHIKEAENPYLHHFMDVVFDFQQNNRSDIASFLDFIEEKRNSLALQMPESSEAVKITTIHKSKGLEFQVVILPYLDFNVAIHNNQNFLVEVEENIIYTRLSGSNGIQEIEAAGISELNSVFMDKLNLLYVALTRPKERLYAMNFHKKGQLGDRIHSWLSQMKTEIIDGRLVLESGKNELRETELKTKQDAFFIPKDISERLWYPDIVLRKPRQSENENAKWEERTFGNLFHKLMENCNASDQLEKALLHLQNEQGIDSKNFEKLKTQATNFFAKIETCDWLGTCEEIISEELILVADGTDRRPDKILVGKEKIWVLDFKTGSQKRAHQRQIATYERLLEELFGKEVGSLLYYTETDELIQVD